jgi:hypothetical protein
VTSKLRLSTVAVATTAAVLSAGGASLAASSPHAQAAAGHQIKSGKTKISLNSATANALLADGVLVTPTGRAKFNTKTFVFSFPVTGGSFTSASRGTFKHAGGLKVTKQTKHITIRNLVIKLHSLSGTAVVSGHGRMSALTLTPPQGGSAHSVIGYTVKLSKPLFKVLDKKFHTKDFKKHRTLGLGSTTKLKFKK